MWPRLVRKSISFGDKNDNVPRLCPQAVAQFLETASMQPLTPLNNRELSSMSITFKYWLI